MSTRLPKTLTRVLLLVGIALLILGAHLEIKQLDLLQKHPILVNLLSGTIGFCFGALAFSVILGRLLELARNNDEDYSVAVHIDDLVKIITRVLESQLLPGLAISDVEVKQVQRQLAEANNPAIFILNSHNLRDIAVSQLLTSMSSWLEIAFEQLQGLENRPRDVLRCARVASVAIDQLILTSDTTTCVRALTALTRFLEALEQAFAGPGNDDTVQA